MTGATDDPLETLFFEWFELQEKGESQSAAAICGDQSHLVGPLEARIAAFKQAKWMEQTGECPDSAALKNTEADWSDASSKSSPSTAIVPGYEIESELGRGGMGVVYRARDLKLNRRVALKMILAAEHAGAHEVERFRVEAQSIAQLTHPNIVQIFEIGEHNGMPYVSLELIDGGDLTSAVHNLQPVRSAAQVLRDIAFGVQAAHSAGIVHRDLKPNNILLSHSRYGALQETVEFSSTPEHAAEPGAVTEAIEASAISQSRVGSRSAGSTWIISKEDADQTQTTHTDVPIPKITDFGLARRLDVESDRTTTGAILGTPTYMAPEQASGLSKDVGPSADIYSLGAMLYALLTGRPPFMASNIIELLNRVRSEEPLPPSQVVNTVPIDLETICLKCLEKSPDRRYQSAQEVAEELDRYLNGEPIIARPVGRIERAIKFARRRPAIAALIMLATMFIASLMVGLPLMTKLYFEAEDSRGLADGKAAAATRAEGEAREAEAEARKAKDAAIESEKHAVAAAIEASRQSATLATTTGLRRLDDGDHYIARVYLAEALRLDEERLKLTTDDTERQKLIDRIATHRQRFACLLRPVPRIDRVFFRDHLIGRFEVSPDGKRLAATYQGGVMVWNLQTGQELDLGIPNGLSNWAQFSSDGSRVVAVSTELTGPAVSWWFVWDAKTGKQLATAQMEFRAKWAKFSSSGERLVVWSDRAFHVFNARTAEAVLPEYAKSANIKDITFRGENELIVRRKTIHLVHNAVSGQREKRTDLGVYIDISPGGKLLAAAISEGEQHRIDIRAMSDLELVRTIETNVKIKQLHFTRRGTRIVGVTEAVGTQQQILVFDASSGDKMLQMAVPEFGMPSVRRSWRVSPDGSMLAILSAHRVRVWSLEDGQMTCPVLMHSHRVANMNWTPDGSRLLTLTTDGALRSWNFDTQPLEVFSQAHDSAVQAVRFQPQMKGESRLAVGLEDGTVQIVDAANGKELTGRMDHADPVKKLIFSPSGRVLAVLAKGALTLWQSSNGEKLMGPRKVDYPITWARLTADDRFLLFSWGGWFWVMDFQGEKPNWVQRVTSKDVRFVDFTSDGRHIVTVSSDHVIAWDRVTRKKVWEESLTKDVGYLGWARSGGLVRGERDVYSIDQSGFVRVFDRETGEPKIRFAAARMSAADVDSAGQLVAIGDDSGVTRVWRLSDGIPITPPMEHTDAITQVAFSPSVPGDPKSGSRLLICSRDGTARVWDIRTGEPVTQLFRGQDAILSGDFAADGRRFGIAGEDGQVRVLSMPPQAASQSAKALELRSQLESSRRLEDGVLQPIPPAELHRIWRQLEALEN